VPQLLSDERLSRRLATGEAAAFDELYRLKRQFGFLSWEQTFQKLFQLSGERV